MSESSVPKQLQLGTLTVGTKIGEGGFGTVYKAKIKGISKEFAIKFYEPSAFNVASDETVPLKRFIREAEILFSLRHPYVIPIYGVGEHGGKPYILMEYFNGSNLYKARESHKGTLTPERVLPFFERVAQGLSYAHSQGVIHRDIRPSNIMALRGEPRILDFGIGILKGGEQERITRTRYSPVGGQFAAPELIPDPKLIDHRSDIYSLGAVWFWLLTGSSPVGVNWQVALRAQAKISLDYERVILRCLDQLDARYQTLDELVADVRALQEGKKPTANASELPDEQAHILKAVAGHCFAESHSVSFYQLQQELGRLLEPWQLTMYYRRLLRIGLLREDLEESDYGDSFPTVRITNAGLEWIEENQLRLRQLSTPPMESVATSSEAVVADDDIPF